MFQRRFRDPVASAPGSVTLPPLCGSLSSSSHSLISRLPSFVIIPNMNLKDFLLAEMNREADRSRHALEQVPEGKADWKPHEKSMAFGYLTNMVATIPMWIGMQINQDELDIAPKDGPKFEQQKLNTSAEYIAALDKAAADTREAFEKTTDEHLK